MKRDVVGKQYKSKYDACENGLIKTEVTYDSSENVQLDETPQNNVQPQRVESSCISPNDQPHFRHKIQYTSLKDHKRDVVGKQHKSKYDACENGLIKTEVTDDSSENVQVDETSQNNVQPQRVESSRILPNDQPHFRHKIQHTSLKDHEALCKNNATIIIVR
eukprot:CAMPEP_0194443426 /NCGR_PEP_ID=MMETSP0176-20130528/126699_1 /TAXON_ID=216777 /ORGANISM="Proboscia alata, Strain PI-D3" /LENGTH=161 /DNA_ID=CAMNT_0039269673 /DNA_START=132 /DNA_END=617 /DNA_ORIENTATION=-